MGNNFENGQENSEGHRNDIVKITVNDDKYDIHRGRRTVSEIKAAGKVEQADKLEQVINGKLVPLDDNGSVVIKGGEEFKSHIPSGGSS